MWSLGPILPVKGNSNPLALSSLGHRAGFFIFIRIAQKLTYNYIDVNIFMVSSTPLEGTALGRKEYTVRPQILSILVVTLLTLNSSTATKADEAFKEKAGQTVVWTLPPLAVESESVTLLGRTEVRGVTRTFLFGERDAQGEQEVVAFPTKPVGEWQAVVDGLKPDTSYRYQFVIDGPDGPRRGEWQNFTTAPPVEIRKFRKTLKEGAYKEELGMMMQCLNESSMAARDKTVTMSNPLWERVTQRYLSLTSRFRETERAHIVRGEMDDEDRAAYIGFRKAWIQFEDTWKKMHQEIILRDQ